MKWELSLTALAAGVVVVLIDRLNPSLGEMLLICSVHTIGGATGILMATRIARRTT